MIDKKVLKDLQKIIEENLDPSMFPYAKGNSIRIGNYVIRKNRHGFNIFDLKHKQPVSCVFSKTAAVAIAKKHAEGQNVVNEVMKLDYEIEKNYNDAVFFQHSYDKSNDELRKEVLECRLDIATTKIDKGRTRLEDYIYN